MFFDDFRTFKYDFRTFKINMGMSSAFVDAELQPLAEEIEKTYREVRVGGPGEDVARVLRNLFVSRRARNVPSRFEESLGRFRAF